MQQSGKMGNNQGVVPGGFRHFEQQSQGSILFWDRSKNSEDSKHKQILTSPGFIIKKSTHTHTHTPSFAFVTTISGSELYLYGVFIEHE